MLAENFVKELSSAKGSHIATMIMSLAELGAHACTHVQPDMGASQLTSKET
jgi:hypothetical protein